MSTPLPPLPKPRRALLTSERRDRLLVALSVALTVAIRGARQRPQSVPEPALTLKRLFDTSATVKAHRRRRRRWTAFALLFALGALLARALWRPRRSEKQAAQSPAGEDGAEDDHLAAQSFTDTS